MCKKIYYYLKSSAEFEREILKLENQWVKLLCSVELFIKRVKGTESIDLDIIWGLLASGGDPWVAFIKDSPCTKHVLSAQDEFLIG